MYKGFTKLNIRELFVNYLNVTFPKAGESGMYERSTSFHRER